MSDAADRARRRDANDPRLQTTWHGAIHPDPRPEPKWLAPASRIGALLLIAYCIGLVVWSFVHPLRLR